MKIFNAGLLRLTPRRGEGMGILGKIISALVVLLMAAGCAMDTEYLYNAEKKAPVLIFTSDFYGTTKFSVNTNPSGDNSCKDLRLAGSIEGRPDKKELKIQVPAGQAVAVEAYCLGGLDSKVLGGSRKGCGPMFISFTPQRGETYRVHMKLGLQDCQLESAA
jgi:hypothetical protein